MIKIAILASGAGSNAHNILQYFKNSESIHVSLIVTNKADAGVLNIAEQFGIPSLTIARADFQNTDHFLHRLKKERIDFIVLAGFLWKIPASIVEAFPKKIVNIHPALLPKYGGKGMYGHFVHEAVHAHQDKESGITIHYVNAAYDEGDIIFQARIALKNDDTPLDIERKVRALEMEFFPSVIAKLLQ